MDDEVFEKAKEEDMSKDEAEELQELMENHGLDQDEAEHVKEIMDTEGLDEEEAVELKDDCEICKLMKTRNVTPEALKKAFSLQNFLNNFPKDKSERNN